MRISFRITHLIAVAALACCLESSSTHAGLGTVIVNEDFEDGKIDGFDAIPPVTPSTKIITGDSHGVGNKAYQITYATDEFGAVLERYSLTFGSIDVSYSQKLPDGIPIQQSVRGFCFLKDFRLFNPDGGNNPDGTRRTTTVEPAIEFHRLESGPARWRQQIGVFRVDGSDFAFVPEINIVPGQWHRVRYYVKYNDPGQRNGRLKYWFNGQLQVDAKDLWFCDTIVQRPSGVFVGGNFSNGGVNPDFAFRRLLDDVQIAINGDAPDNGGQLTVSPIAKQTINEDGVTVAIPVTVSRGGAALGTVKLTATSSSPAIVPADGLTVTGSGANWTVKAKPAANKHGTTTIRVQGYDGAGVAATAFDVVIKPVADTPSMTVASTTKNTLTTCGLVVSRNRADGAEVTHFKVTNIVNGTLYLKDGLTAVPNGRFLTFAQANAGLRFKPATGFLGTATFDLRASVSATDVGLGGSVVKGQILVTP